MRYFTLLWDPHQDPAYAEVFRRFADGGAATHRFSCGNRKDIRAGERVILRQVGSSAKGVVGIGDVSNPTYQVGGRNFIDVHWLRLSLEPLIRADDPLWGGVTQLWTAMAGGQIIAEGFGEALFEAVLRSQVDSAYEAAEGGALIAEGALLRRMIIARDRKRSVRVACIEHHKAVCAVCGFDGEELGDEFVGLIDVHHKYPMALLKGERETDPVGDCVPLCPTCHRMAHHKMPVGTCRSIDELKQKHGYDTGR